MRRGKIKEGKKVMRFLSLYANSQISLQRVIFGFGYCANNGNNDLEIDGKGERNEEE